MEKMNEQKQNTQGESFAERVHVIQEEHSEIGAELFNSGGDLLSSPRQSELSLISGSSGLLDQSQHGGVRYSKEVRDPNFPNQLIGSSKNSRKDKSREIEEQDTFSAAKQQNVEMFSYTNDQAQLQQQVYGNYQTQKLQQLQAITGEQFEQTQIIPDRLSQIMQRQSLPQGPITDRQRASVLIRDSMLGARQGLQGAANGGSSLEHPYANSQIQMPRIQNTGFNNSVTNDRLSSVQFMLSQSDKECTMTASQNFINVADAANIDDRQLYLQWSLTQSAGLDSIGSESKNQQLIQQFNSQASFDPMSYGVRSEDYQSHFNSSGLHKIAEQVSTLKPGEHQKPIVINSLTTVPITGLEMSSSSSSLQLMQGLSYHQLCSSDKKTAPAIQHAGEYGDILSSPSETMIADRSNIDLSTVLSQQNNTQMKGSQNVQDSQRKEEEKQDLVGREVFVDSTLPTESGVRSNKTNQMIQSCFDKYQVQNESLNLRIINQKTPEHRYEDADTAKDDYPTNTIQTPEEAQNCSIYQSKAMHDMSMMSLEQSAQVPNPGKPPLSHSQNKEYPPEDLEASRIKDDEEEEDEEDGFALISVRANPDSNNDDPYSYRDMNTNGEDRIGQLQMSKNSSDSRPKQHSAEQTKIQLPLPCELFGDKRAQDFEQPMLSAKIELPKAIFSDDHDDDEKNHQQNFEHDFFPVQDRNYLTDSLAQKEQVSERKNLPAVIEQEKLASNLMLKESINSIEESKRDTNLVESHMQPLQIDHLNANFIKTNSKQPLILTDLHMTSSSSTSKELNSAYSSQNRDSFRPELRPEELEKDPSPREQQKLKDHKVPEKLDKSCKFLQNNPLATEAGKNDFKARSNEEISILISRQTSQFSDAQSPSLVLSQTNQERMTLTSMMYTQEKQYQNQPSTGRKHYNRLNFAQTSEKKSTGFSQHKHLPSVVFNNSLQNALAVKDGIIRQQSCSSFNNTSLRDGRSSPSRHSYFVNALGQRVSSDVFNKQFDPADAQLQSLFARNNNSAGIGSNQRIQIQQIAPVEEFGRETMSSIPDEAVNSKPDQHDDLKFTTVSDLCWIKDEEDRATNNHTVKQAGRLEPASIPADPSSLQSVTEINFCSMDDTTARNQALSKGKSSQKIGTIGNSDTRQMTHGVEYRQDNDIEGSKVSVKRNLNLLDAFKTQMVPNQGQKIDQKQSKNAQYDMQYSSVEDNVFYQQPQSISRDVFDESETMIQSSCRPPHYSEDLPVFKTHEGMSSHQNRGDYSLKVQQQFYKRYNKVKECATLSSSGYEQPTRGRLMRSCNSVESSRQGQKLEDSEAYIMRGGDYNCKQVKASQRAELQESCSLEDTQMQNSRQQFEQSGIVLTSRDNHVTQDYFYQDNDGQIMGTDHYVQDTQTDEDIAVFRSQLNDIPDDLAQQPIRRTFNAKVQLLAQRHQTEFQMQIQEEEDPIRLRLARSVSKDRRSRAGSLSTYQGTEEENAGTGLEDRLSPKFEKLQQLMSMPSHQEHTKAIKGSPKERFNPKLLLQAVEDQAQYKASSTTTGKSFLQRVATQQQLATLKDKSVLEINETPARQNQLNKLKDTVNLYSQIPEITSSTDCDQGLINQKAKHRVNGSGDANVHVPPIVGLQHAAQLGRDCQTTTNQDAKKRPSLMSAMCLDEAGFLNANQTVEIRKEVMAKNGVLRERSHQRNSLQDQSLINQMPVTQFTSKQAHNNSLLTQTQKSRQTESVPRDLQQWLSSLGLSQYGLLFVEQGLDDLQSLVQMMGQDRVLPLTHQVLEAAGIESSGHRARILINLELEAGVFEQNPQIIELLQTSTMTVDEIFRQAEILFQPAGSTSQSDQGIMRPPRSEQQNRGQTPDDESRYIASPVSCSPLTEQICKGRSDQSPLRPPASSTKLSSQLSLSSWLRTHNLLFLLPIFIRSGFECLRSLILQSFSQFNPLTDEVLSIDVGIQKMGHRMRILSQLRQDALVLFQLEMLYRQSKSNGSVQKPSVGLGLGLPEGQIQDDSLFILPGRQQRHFKSVYTDTTANKNDNSILNQHQQESSGVTSMKQHNKSQQNMKPQVGNQKVIHSYIMQQQHQQVAKKQRTKNYSFNKGVGLGNAHAESVPSSQNTTFRQYQNKIPQSQHRINKNSFAQQQSQTYLKDHLESNLNPWRHSTYFAHSRPIASQNSHYSNMPPPQHHHQSQQHLPTMKAANQIIADSLAQGKQQLRESGQDDSMIVLMRQCEDQSQILERESTIDIIGARRYHLDMDNVGESREEEHFWDAAQMGHPQQRVMMPYDQTERGIYPPIITKSLQQYSNAGDASVQQSRQYSVRKQRPARSQYNANQRDRQLGEGSSNIDEKSCQIF